MSFTRHVPCVELCQIDTTHLDSLVARMENLIRFCYKNSNVRQLAYLKVQKIFFSNSVINYNITIFLPIFIIRGQIGSISISETSRTIAIVCDVFRFRIHAELEVGAFENSIVGPVCVKRVIMQKNEKWNIQIVNN